MTYLYLITLLIAPQLWAPGFKDLPVDYFLYPAWFIALAVRGRLPLLFRASLPDKLMYAFLGWMVVGTLLNGFTDPSKEYLFQQVRMLILFKLVSASLTSTSDIKKVLFFFVVLSVVLAFEAIDHKASPNLIGWAGQRLGWVDPAVLAEGGTGRVRWVGIFDGPGVFCVVFTIALCVCLPFIGGGNGFVATLIALPLVGLMGWATYLTGSRGGFLATLAVAGLFIAVRSRISVTKIVAGAVLCTVVFMAAPPSLTSTRDESKSAQHRVEMWAEGLEMIKQRPLVGIGRGNFKAYTGRLIAHNSVIEIGGEMGVIGLMLWGSLTYLCLRAAFRLRKLATTPSDDALGLGLGLAVIGYLVSAMFVTLEYETWYFLLALCVVVGRQQESMALSRREVKWMLMIIAAFMAFLQIFVLAYMS